MNNWPYRPVSDFLKERTGKYKPNAPEISGYRRLEKIDFSGQIHLSDKATKTNMIIVEPGDLVISGINVAKGALAVYEGTEPVVATIHYSSYLFDKDKIDIDFLKRFLKSPAFIDELQNQVKGGIKTEIKPKHLLPLKVRIPELSDQKTVNLHFDSIESEIADLSSEIQNQTSYLTQLRQAILQEAIEGKLTADWRKENPVRKGDPDYDAEALLEKIKAEKEKLVKEGKIKKQKPLAPVKPEEVPFELPAGWVWTRVINYSKQYVDCPHDTPKYIESGVPCLRAPDVTESGVQLDNVRYVSEPEYIKRIRRLRPEVNDIVYIREGGRLGIAGLIKTDDAVCLGQRVMLLRCFEKASSQFLSLFLNAPDTFKEMVGKTIGAASPHVNVRDIIAHILPVPPFSEQKVIVNRVEKLLSMVDELDRQVSERKEQSEQLMQAVLREAFEGRL